MPIGVRPRGDARPAPRRSRYRGTVRRADARKGASLAHGTAREYRPAVVLATSMLAATVLLATPESAGGAPAVYVALGDSTAVGVGGGKGRGYPDRLARRLEAAGIRVELLNLGENGSTAADLRRHQLPRLEAAGPALVTLGIGTNDVVRGRDVRAFAADLEAIAAAIERTGARAVVSTLPDLSRSPSGAGSPGSLRSRLEAYDLAIREFARRHGYALAEVDLTSRAAQRSSPGSLFSSDGFHPSARGYERWAEAISPAAERALAPRRQARNTTR